MFAISDIRGEGSGVVPTLDEWVSEVMSGVNTFNLKVYTRDMVSHRRATACAEVGHVASMSDFAALARTAAGLASRECDLQVVHAGARADPVVVSSPPASADATCESSPLVEDLFATVRRYEEEWARTVSGRDVLDGFCYGRLFPDEDASDVQEELRAYPTIAALAKVTDKMLPLERLRGLYAHYDKGLIHIDEHYGSRAVSAASFVMVISRLESFGSPYVDMAETVRVGGGGAQSACDCLRGLLRDFGEEDLVFPGARLRQVGLCLSSAGTFEQDIWEEGYRVVERHGLVHFVKTIDAVEVGLPLRLAMVRWADRAVCGAWAFMGDLCRGSVEYGDVQSSWEVLPHGSKSSCSELTTTSRASGVSSSAVVSDGNMGVTPEEVSAMTFIGLKRMAHDVAACMAVKHGTGKGVGRDHDWYVSAAGRNVFIDECCLSSFTGEAQTVAHRAAWLVANYDSFRFMYVTWLCVRFGLPSDVPVVVVNWLDTGGGLAAYRNCTAVASSDTVRLRDLVVKAEAHAHRGYCGLAAGDTLTFSDTPECLRRGFRKVMTCVVLAQMRVVDVVCDVSTDVRNDGLFWAAAFSAVVAVMRPQGAVDRSLVAHHVRKGERSVLKAFRRMQACHDGMFTADWVCAVRAVVLDLDEVCGDVISYEHIVDEILQL